MNLKWKWVKESITKDWRLKMREQQLNFVNACVYALNII